MIHSEELLLDSMSCIHGFGYLNSELGEKLAIERVDLMSRLRSFVEGSVGCLGCEKLLERKTGNQFTSEESTPLLSGFELVQQAFREQLLQPKATERCRDPSDLFFEFFQL